MSGRATVRLAARPISIAAACAAVVVAGCSWLLISEDGSDDLGSTVARLPWLSLLALAALALVMVVHYVSGALALRGVSNRALPLGPTTWTQFAAAAVNRFAPNGVGAAAVNVRYLTRVGLTPGAATSALAALALIGSLVDAAYIAGVTALGPAVGVGGARHELQVLGRAGVTAGGRHSWLFIGIAIALVIVVAIRTRGPLLRGIVSGARHAALHARDLLTSPGQVATAAAASSATTVVLSGGFVLAVNRWGQATHPLSAGALIAMYWVAAAAANAAPLPACFGLTEAALVGALVLGSYTAESATVAVIVFRQMTFWLPVPIGAFAARRLRRRQLL